MSSGITQKSLTQLGYDIVGCAIEVHKHVGPGLLESVYEKCLTHELQLRGLKVEKQVVVPIEYKGVQLESTLRADIIVNDMIIVELKAVELLHPLYKAQLLSYMRLLNKCKGLLINFHVENIAKNVVSLVSEEFSRLPVE